MEEVYQMEFRTKGVDPNFPNDPLYVTLSDREDIFDDHYEMIEDQISFDNFKKHYFFILTITASYIIVYFIFKFGRIMSWTWRSLSNEFSSPSFFIQLV